jgi:hypothetical protein
MGELILESGFKKNEGGSFVIYEYDSEILGTMTNYRVFVSTWGPRLAET